jgi:hypothetical protein
MRRSSVVMGIAGMAVLTIAALAVGAGADPPKNRPPASVSGIVTIDDATKVVWAYDAWLEVPTNGVTEPVGTPIPAGQRLVIETISVAGNGSGPVTEAQAIERVEITAGAVMIAVPLDRYSWGDCPGYEPPENCGNYDRYWKYAGTEAVRAYVDAGDQVAAFAEHPGQGMQQVKVQVLGFLVPVPAGT